MQVYNRYQKPDNSKEWPAYVLGGFCFISCLAYAIYFEQLQISLSSWSFYMVLAISLGVSNAGFLSLAQIIREEYMSSVDIRAKDCSLFIAGAFLVFVSFLGAILSSSMVMTQAHLRLLGPVQESTIKNSALPILDINNAPLVSEDMAMRAAEKQLATPEYSSLGSRVEIGKMEKQRIGNSLYWVGFLQHRDIFKWYSNQTTPGYVRVSAHDPNDVKLVTHLNDKPLQMRYLPSASFFDNLERMTYFKDVSRGVEEFISEVDDTGKPYYVAPVFQRKIGLSGRDVVAVLVIDPQTGEVTQYSIANAPPWIDRIQPQSYIQAQAESFLELTRGWFNFSGQDILRPSGVVDLVFSQNGTPWFYVGYGSKGSDNALVGYLLVNSRTKQALTVKMAGISEAVAALSAERAYSEKAFEATNALPFMVEGIPTYVMALRDESGILRMYAMVSVANMQKIAVADTLEATVRQYLSKLAQNSGAADIDSQANLLVVKGIVERINSLVKNGNSVYILKVNGYPKILNASVDLSEELAITQQGDTVEISLQESKTFATIVKIKNMGLTP